jgi:CheY-like chemotaxis protein
MSAPMRILVIDDDRPTIDLLTTTLERNGHTVRAETSGAAGRERAIAEQFDVIVCDIGLPDVNGFALARQIRTAGVDAPLLALSGYASDEDRRLGLAAGFDNYLTKPIKASALLAEVAFQASRPRSPRSAPRSAPIAVQADEPIATVAPVAAPAPPRRGVLGGLVVVALGVPFILQPLGVPNGSSYLFIAMGIAFLISYLRGHQYVYLIPMVTLCSFGVALLLPTWISMRPESVAPAFVGVIALGFIVAFALAPHRRWPLIPAVLLGAVAASTFVSGTSPIPTALEPFLVPVVLIGVGAYLLAEPQR